MSMLLMTGQVLNVLQAPEGVNREGVKYGGHYQVQLLCEEALQNGEKRNSLFTLTCEDPEKFKKLTGQNVAVPVGCWARGGVLSFYMEKGGIPKVLNVAQSQ